MRKITMTVAAFLATVAISAADVTNNGLKMTVGQGQSSVSTEFSLPKGSYVFDGGTNTNLTVTVTLDGKTSALTEGKLTLDKATTITVTATYLVSGQATLATTAMETTVKVTPDATQLQAIKDKYTLELSTLYNKANGYDSDKTLQALAVDASALMGEINKFGIEQYVEYQEKGKLADLESKITEIGDKISAAQANYEAYTNAEKVGAELQTQLDELKKVYDKKVAEVTAADKDADVSDYKDTYEGAKKLVDDFKADAETAYKDQTAASVFSESNISANKSSIESSIKLATESIQSGTTNALSYANVKNAIAKANIEYKKIASEMYCYLLETKEGNLYSDTYTQALNVLRNEWLGKVDQVEKDNEAKYKEGKADADSQKEFEAQIDAAKQGMQGVWSQTKTNVDNWRSYYTAATKDVAEQVEGVFKSKVKTYTENKTYADAKTYFATDLSTIQAQIDALNASVESADKKHSLTSATAPFGIEKYADNKAAILKLIDELQPKVANAVAEINAHNAAAATIKSVNKSYTDVKAKAENAKDATYNYKNFLAKGKFTATETAIEESIATLNTENDAAYNKSKADFNEKPTDAVTFNNGLSAKTTKVTESIEAYKTAMSSAMTSYKTVYDQYTDFQKALDALTKAATNTDVTIDGKVPGTSYAAQIATYKDSYNAIVEALKNAYDNYNDVKDKDGNDIVSVLLELAKSDLFKAVNSDKVSEINTLATNYDTHKTAWEKNSVIATKESTLERANALVEEMEKKLVTYDATEYGLKATELNTKKTEYKSTLDGYKDEIKAAKGQDASAETIALLSEINTKLEKLKTNVQDLTDKAAKAKDAYAAETTAYKALTAEIAELEVKVKGGEYVYGKLNDKDLYREYAGIDATLKGKNTSHRRNLDNEISALNSTISTLKSAIEASYKAETVCADQEDKTVDKQPVSGYKSRLASAQKVFAALEGFAKNEEANDANYIAFNAELAAAKVSDLIITAKADVAKVATGDGLTYFNSVITNYETAYNKIVSDKSTYYKNVTKVKVEGTEYTNLTDTGKNMTANHNELTMRLDDLVGNIKNVATKAKANETAHTELVKNYNASLDTWTKVFETVSGALTSTYHETAIKTLNDAKAKLNTFKDDLAADFKKGDVDTNKSKLQKQLDAINTTVGELSNNWASQYDAAVTTDNEDRYREFNQAYDSLTVTYKEYVTKVTEMSKTSFASEVTDKLVDLTGENGIYSYAEKIRSLKSKADEEYQATVKSVGVTDLYDVNSVNKTTASLYKATIIELSEKYFAAVNEAAQYEYASDLAYANKVYKNAYTEITFTTPATDKEADEALKNVLDIIQKASALQKEDGSFVDNMALQYENTYKAQLSKVADFIPADKLAAANLVWNNRYEEAVKLAMSESEEIAKFHSLNGTDYVTPYKELAENINDAAEAWDEIEEADKFENFDDAYYILDEFVSTYIDRPINENETVTHTNIYWSAYDANNEYVTNNTYYNKLIDAIDSVQYLIDDAKAFADDMIVAREMDNTIQYLQSGSGLGWYKAVAEESRNEGKSALTFNNYKLWLDSFASYWIVSPTAGVKYETIVKEYARIKVVIGELSLDYENATAHDISDATIDEYKKIFAGYSEENEKIYKAFTDSLDSKSDESKFAAIDIAKEAYLALEKKIGTTKSELTALYAATANAEAQAKLQASIDDVKDTQEALVKQLSGCHTPVKDQYETKVTDMGKAIEPVQAKLDASVKDATVLLYEDLISTSIKKVADAYAGLGDEIAEMEAPYRVNDSVYIELRGVLETLTTSLKEVYDKTEDFVELSQWYKYTEIDEDESENVYYVYEKVREHEFKSINDAISAEQNRIDKLNAKGIGLTAESTVDKSDIMSQIVAYERRLSHHNAQVLSSTSATDEPKAMISKLKMVENKIAENTYSDNYADLLADKVDSIKQEIKIVSIWNTQFSRHSGFNSVTEDEGKFETYYLNGDPDDAKNKSDFYNEELGGWKYYADYYAGTTPYLAIMNNIAKIDSAIVALDKDADKIVGDADGDGVVGVNDYTYIVNIIMESSLVEIPAEGTEAFKLADANCDGKIDVADAVAVVNAILGNTSTNSVVRRAPRYDAGSSMSIVGEGSGYNQRIAINLNSSLPFVGGQIDLVLPEGMTVSGTSLGDRASSMELRSATLKSGVTRLLISSIENNEIEGTEGAVAYIDVNVDTSYKGQAIEMSSAVFADADGIKYSIGLDGEATGINTVSTAEYIKGKVYSVGGQVLDGLKKGVNIIRNTDGTSKKVLVK